MTRDRVLASEIYEASDISPPDFPKYTTQIMNLANQNSQGTRPKVVGQMSELIQESDPDNFEEWKRWYTERYPDAIERATKKIAGQVEKLEEAIEKIDEALIREWVEDLVLLKTAEGLLIQRAVFEHLAEVFGASYRPSTSEEEARGIDGYVEGAPVSVKPESYKSKTSVKHEDIDAAMVFYKKTKKYLHIVYDEDDFA
ncbi:MAG: restriction endonuclease [Bacteroidetes bacterium QS_9_68_14]|nr:MAG: restriction endonuclease [Bacteroidetes bacterium QS_9_68_14]